MSGHDGATGAVPAGSQLWKVGSDVASLVNALKETLTLAVAWVGAAVGIFAGTYMLGMLATGEDLSLCGGGPTIVSGIAFVLPTVVSITLAGATVLVGGYWSLGLRRRPLRLVMLAAVAGLAVAAVSAGAIVAPGCGGGLLGL
jgi:hypothetical protein